MVQVPCHERVPTKAKLAALLAYPSDVTEIAE